MNILSLFFLLVLSCVFIFSGILKLKEPWGFADSIVGYRLVPGVFVNLLVLLLPPLECVAGIGVMVPFLRRAALWMIGAMLFVFLGALVQAVARGLVVDCGCFGDGEASLGSMFASIGRDIVLLGMVAWLLWRERSRGGSGWVSTGAKSKTVFSLALPTFLRACFLFLMAVLVSAGVNFTREIPIGFSYIEKSERLANSVRRTTSVTVEYANEARGEATFEEIVHFVAHKPADVLLLDVRPRLFFKDGHIEGAFCFPLVEFEKVYQKDFFSNARRVIVYCDGVDCDSAEVVAGALKRLGHAQVVVYRGGWKEWLQRSTGGAGNIN